jgi:hypothetical protein
MNKIKKKLKNYNLIYNKWTQPQEELINILH